MIEHSAGQQFNEGSVARKASLRAESRVSLILQYHALYVTVQEGSGPRRPFIPECHLSPFLVDTRSSGATDTLATCAQRPESYI